MVKDERQQRNIIELAETFTDFATVNAKNKQNEMRKM